MKLVEHYIMRGTRRLVLIIVGFLIPQNSHPRGRTFITHKIMDYYEYPT